MAEHYNINGIELPPYALDALRILETAGFEAWCVGGFVRDALLGQTGKDIDVATAATWETVRDLFTKHRCKVFETGVKHGTVTVLIDGNPLEVTTYRREGAYSDKRHPDAVIFVQSIEDDLTRRDFTMNAIAFHPDRGFCDPYKGREAIERRMICAVGNPEKRFGEDALRILRACRFASQLGFSIEAETEQAMIAFRRSLDCIAVERVRQELDKLFCGAFIHDALMGYFPIICQIIPEAAPMQGFDQKTPYHLFDVLEHTAYCMQQCPRYPLVRWAAFFHDIGKPDAFFADEAGIGHFYGHAKISVELSRTAMKRLKAPPSFIHDVNLLIMQHDDVIPATPKAVKRAIRRLDGRVDLFRALCDLKRGDALAQAPRCRKRVTLADDLDKILDTILADEEVLTRQDLAIDGNDIIALGVPAGPDVGSLLECILDAVLDEKVCNDRDALVAFARDVYAGRTHEETSC